VLERGHVEVADQDHGLLASLLAGEISIELA
jgi:hypothetical protein